MMERFCHWLAWRLPRAVVRWCFVRVVAETTTGRWSRTHVPDLTVTDAFDRFDGGTP